MTELAKRPLDQQIDEIRLAIAHRKLTDTMLVARGKSSRAEADEHQARLEAILRTLTFIKANEVAIRRVVSRDL